MLPHPLEASPQKANLEILLQNMTPNSRISAIISQDLLSQHSRNSEALSQQLLSQSSHLSPAAVTEFSPLSQHPPAPQNLPLRQKFKEAMAQAGGKRRGER